MPGAKLWAAGEYLEIESSRPNQDKWLLKFTAYETRELAAALRNSKLYAQRIEHSQSLLTDLIGFEVYDQAEQRLGVVTSIVGNPASDLLEIDESLLIPSVFKIAEDLERRVVRVNLPDGLIESLSGN